MIAELIELGPLIASRRLTLASKKQAIIKIGQPFIPPDGGGNYCCPYRIEGVGDGAIGCGWGIDSLQALYLALINVSTDLYTSEEAQAGQITWEGERELGLPFDEAIRNLVPKRGMPTS